ncbi:MAG TPA: GyrI-like domain-containing protein [Fibrobacteria bacterium]|nr:GyrI-like domain-containing protein [Fibrobacteria bacterium]
MEIIDYKAPLKKFYRPTSGAVELVDVPPMTFLMIDGQGHPDTSPEYQEAAEALTALALALKSAIRKSDGIDYGVMPLESLWGSGESSRFSMDRKADWKWTLMIHQPSAVTRKVYERVLADLKAKQPLPAMPRLRLEALAEGRAAQKLHVGPLSGEGAAVQAVQDRIHAIGAKLSGKHHEVYLSDMRKAAPEKWKTVIRRPYE